MWHSPSLPGEPFPLQSRAGNPRELPEHSLQGEAGSRAAARSARRRPGALAESTSAHPSSGRPQACPRLWRPEAGSCGDQDPAGPQRARRGLDAFRTPGTMSRSSGAHAEQGPSRWPPELLLQAGSSCGVFNVISDKIFLWTDVRTGKGEMDARRLALPAQGQRSHPPQPAWSWGSGSGLPGCG